MKVPKKQSRTAILYARITPQNREWLRAEAKRFGYKREAEFLDVLLSELRRGKRDDRNKD